VLAPLTTVVNTFGGTYFDKDWTAQVTAPAFEQATDFYVNLVRSHGEAGAAQSGFTECLNNLEQSKVAMWYDATSAAGSLDGKGSPVAGTIGYVQAPVVKTKSSGWLYTWSCAIQNASRHKDNAWKFVSWASSRQYEELVGQQLGWSNVPAGKRASTYTNPDYLKSAAAFAKPTLEAIQSADPTNPGVQPRPTQGIQFVDIPEFTDFGQQISQYISSAIAGKTSAQSALSQSQSLLLGADVGGDGVDPVGVGLFAVDTQVGGVLTLGVVVGVGDGFELHCVEVADLDGVADGGERLDRLPGQRSVEGPRLRVGVHDERVRHQRCVLRARSTTPAWSSVSK